jgi:nucleoid-associated protein YgaU
MGTTTSGNTGNAGTTNAPQPTTPTYTPPTTPPSVANSERMGLTTPSPAGGTDATKVASATPATPEKEKTTIHTVQKGETLSSIAAKYMGNARYATAIAKANPNIHPNRISVGAKLKIPAVQAPTTAPAGTGSTTVVSKVNPSKSEVKPLPPVDPSRAYTVKTNDSWTALSKKFLGHDNWTILYEYNKERFPRNSRALKPGMLLEIPPKDVVAPKASATAKDNTAAKDNAPKTNVVAKSGPAPKK